MARRLLLALLGLAGCVSPPDVIIEVGPGRPDPSGSGAGSGSGEGSGGGSGEGSAADPWVAPGRAGESILAIEVRPGRGWSVGVVVASDYFVGVSPGGAPIDLHWRDAAGREGAATPLFIDRRTGLFLAGSRELEAPPIALPEELPGSSDRVIGHPTFGVERGGWMTLAFDRAREQCTNGVDDDGNGLVDCLDAGCGGAAACNTEWPEDCRNSRDDDGDGFIDCGDADCERDSQCSDSCDGSRMLALPSDVGLDGAALVDDCGRLTGIVGIAERRIPGNESCRMAADEAAETAAPLEPLACVSGARPEIPLGEIRALLAAADVRVADAVACQSETTVAVRIDNAARGMAVSGTTLAMLRRARSMVYAGPGFSAVKVAEPPLLIAPTDALPPLDDSPDDLVGIDGTTVSLASSFQWPEPLSATLSALFYPLSTTAGFPLAARSEAVAGNDYYLIGHPDTLGCGAGWVVSMVKLVAFGAGDELIFEGPGYSVGAAIVTATGGLLAVATECEPPSATPISPALASGEPLALSKGCAIIGSRIPVP
ncbi:MAG: hypothetical protein HQ461_07210 [Deltaproteobacteria bacterium]|nr:hypothetical protein [Deltaproteobacteria bacterium]